MSSHIIHVVVELDSDDNADRVLADLRKDITALHNGDYSFFGKYGEEREATGNWIDRLTVL